MSNKDKVLKLYFIDKYKQIEIVKMLNISRSTVNRIIMADERYVDEKSRRQKENKIKNRTNTINYIVNKRKKMVNDVIYEKMKRQHILDVFELSDNRKTISNKIYRDCNPSIYEYNSKAKSYVLKSGIDVGFDAPKKIKWK